MSQLQITNAGIDYRNAVFAGDEVQNITHFVFANIPGQDETAPIDANTTIPANILHTQPIKAVSKVDGNAIVMSAVLGYGVGNFEYNWYGVVATKANNQQVLIAVVTTATQTKTKTVGPITGNYSVKSVLWRSQNIADQLNITLSALPWQVQEGELVSRADFDAHNHDNLYAKLTDITNTLTSTAINKSLSANQGRVLKGLIDNKLDSNSKASDSSKLNGQLAGYYAKASDVQQATTTSRGTVEKATTTEAETGAANKFPDAAAVKSAIEKIGTDNFVPLIGESIVEGSVKYNNGMENGTEVRISTDNYRTYIQSYNRDDRNNESRVIRFQGYGVDLKRIEITYNGGTHEILHKGIFDPDEKADKTTLDSRLPKPAVKHYNGIGNITVDFNQAIKHVVTRYGTENATITLEGTIKAGDELVVINVRDDSGTATITGKTMFTGVGGESAATHTLTGQAKVTMFGYDTPDRLMIAEVV